LPSVICLAAFTLDVKRRDNEELFIKKQRNIFSVFHILYDYNVS